MKINKEKARKWFKKFGVDPEHVLLEGLQYHSQQLSVFPPREFGEVVYFDAGPRPWKFNAEGVLYTVRTITVSRKPDWMEN